MRIYRGGDLAFNVTGLTPGQSYQFRVRTLNAEGAGPYSANQTITPQSAPSQPAAPSVAYSSDSPPKLNFAWTLPEANGAALQRSRLLVRTAAGVFTILSSGGCEEVLIAAGPNPACQVEVAVLLAAPFLLSANDPIVAAVEA